MTIQRKHFQNELITLVETAELLRVSKHTIQAWISPSSPNHRPDFARLARKAGRKTVFPAEELSTWIDQRRFSTSCLPGLESSPHWFERFVAKRGMLKNRIKPPTSPGKRHPGGFRGGRLGIDSGPLLAWMTDSADAGRLQKVISKAESLVLAAPLCSWLLFRVRRIPKIYSEVESFLFSSGVFEIAPFDESSVRRMSDFPDSVSESAAINCAAALEFGASGFATWNEGLLESPGLPVFCP